jgi:hypothetical protein
MKNQTVTLASDSETFFTLPRPIQEASSGHKDVRRQQQQKGP